MSSIVKASWYLRVFIDKEGDVALEDYLGDERGFGPDFG